MAGGMGIDLSQLYAPMMKANPYQRGPQQGNRMIRPDNEMQYPGNSFMNQAMQLANNYQQQPPQGGMQQGGYQVSPIEQRGQFLGGGGNPFVGGSGGMGRSPSVGWGGPEQVRYRIY